MGDIADDYFDSGMDAWILHQMGECDSLDECQYCREEESKTKKRKPPKE